MEKAPGLVKKLAEVMKKVGYIEKRGHNAFHNYDYVTESDVVDALRDHLSNAGIMSVPNVEKITVEKLEKGIIAFIEVAYQFTDGNESIIVRVGGAGSDTPGDKAIYKAMTGAEKYALKQLFLIPTGDDPERDEKDSGVSGTAQNVQRGSESQPPNRSGSSRPDNKGSERPATHDKTPPEEKDRTVAFGKNKGKKLEDLEEIDLVAWTKTCEESVAKKDPKWHRINEARFAACQKEWERRQPWRALWQECLKIGAEFQLDEVGVSTVLKDRMGIKSADQLEGAQDVEDFRRWLEEQQQG